MASRPTAAAGSCGDEPSSRPRFVPLGSLSALTIAASPAATISADGEMSVEFETLQQVVNVSRHQRDLPAARRIDIFDRIIK